MEMGVMENLMVHTEISKVKSQSNGEVEKRGVSVLENGGVCKLDRMSGLKFKRRKVFAVRDFPPGCGSRAMEVKIACENGNVVEDVKVVESLVKEEESLGQRDASENVSDIRMAEPVEVQPLRICLPGGDVVRDLSVTAGDECSNSEQIVAGSGVSSSSGTENIVRDIVVYADESSLGMDNLDQTQPLEIEMSDVAVAKPRLVAGRKKAKKGIACHSSLKVVSREFGEGSRKKKSKKNLYWRDRESLDSPEQLRILGVGTSSGSSSGDSSRNKVKETLRLFHGVCRKILQEDEAKPEDQRRKGKGLRIDFEASTILKRNGKFLNSGVHILGEVPGVEVGDEFQYRMELNILGIHKPSQAGIDYMKYGKAKVATSIVASGGYDDHLDNSDVLTYTGQGGNVMQVKKKGEELKEPEDQKLITGNLALATSIEKQTPVRVIRGKHKSTHDKSKGGNYVYDGLYLVEKYWQQVGSHGMNVFKFQLRRIPGQPELSWVEVKKSKSKYREGLCKLDISEGKEQSPISAVNEIDDEKPPLFTYTVKLIYPDWCRPVPPKSCCCTTRCTEAEARVCACVEKNGGEIPYNFDGAIVGAKPTIYECGPLCKCPSSCYLRVTQHGIKLPLEIFKTKSRGWGVRCLKSIPIGSFICEYVGELLEDSEAERRIGNDEYLFDIGNRYDNSLAQGMSELMLGTQAGRSMAEGDESSGFTIDAASKGNVGRFINHSCSPNLYAQNVLYDHEDSRIPHVMFFAQDNIPPLQELCYDYNYALDQVRDSKGNIKQKPCFCGAAVCRRRLY
ncbi:SU(VAR)3-9 homolog 6 [Arabidopsis thaliana]|jgi:euchromatic histone-lysine N-methyltransferase|uniref:Histone-lysine N-methyltransferase, H3 lysine-9 specific SUVH6 n=1 Tax=Arabidopsis thaliana TaxID=3702 RepID=SUVH6_ARATH|nr:SU(VAR)3-9 homolog 6 [Arabidopsis thaliana]NP_973514.1 SU(VAR)3-9 homolog 6 [Arabidopsis thaliana]Q8VZ17.2 RecName: Full=Histone-lysine N-methyltransferase, H3 lysine-9 specific SUVH6; AltName: Full=Histone H3-K9 methyltransferase 6; Short=H3-K9-HMTase 6; AltName: Full=Protein SET DOMAIN GROUP 23; AltName: Full=Suppressor of variegation 3-9 homolog protein 6; Short=Su(var)3-9 homolog protein 6 [Arabidopsis thaliana]AAK28971.1 SUVH6 [Arabidopsis thaliana]AAO22580.1 putative mammalian MHC III |eukprot:NP_850030.1 SU(VAR)3-9 homolog 6 [Arabidopsis thaliana]